MRTEITFLPLALLTHLNADVRVPCAMCQDRQDCPAFLPFPPFPLLLLLHHLMLLDCLSLAVVASDDDSPTHLHVPLLHMRHHSNLSRDPDLKHLLPIDGEGRTLYEKVKDGILLW